MASISSSLNWFFFIYLLIHLSLRCVQLLYSSGDVVGGGGGCCCCRCSGHGHCLFRSYFIIVSTTSSFLRFNFFAVRVFAVSSFFLSFIVPFFCYLVMFYFVFFLFDFFARFGLLLLWASIPLIAIHLVIRREIFQSVNEQCVAWCGVLSSVMWPLLLLSITLSVLSHPSVRSFVYKHSSTYDLYYYVNSFHWTWVRNNNNNKKDKNRSKTFGHTAHTPNSEFNPVQNLYQAPIHKMKFIFTRVFSVGE